MYAQHSVINYGKRPTFKNRVAAKVELKVTQIVMYKGSECDEKQPVSNNGEVFKYWNNIKQMCAVWSQRAQRRTLLSKL